MRIEGVIRPEDRDKIFKKVMLHHTYDHHALFNFGSKRRESSQSNRSSQSEKGAKPSSRKNSIDIKKFIRRGSTAVYHPRRTSNVSSSLLPVQEGVS